MTSQKIVLSGQDHGLGQIGGGARLKDASLWPRSPDTDEPMTPLLTLSDRFLPVTFIPPGMAITVFITACQQDGAFNRSTQRHYTVNQQSELDEKRANRFARVILHELADQSIAPPAAALLLDRAYIQFEPFSDEEEEQELEDEDSGIDLSKPVGRPCWLQDPIYEPQRFLFLMQLLDSDVAAASRQHVGLFSDGIGYLYVDRQARRGKQGDEAGFFFIQFT
ncbi:hypothetical protein JET64_00735 [Pseudomonas putida]|nr:hypothetical protein [Pseudomonas putida]